MERREERMQIFSCSTYLSYNVLYNDDMMLAVRVVEHHLIIISCQTDRRRFVSPSSSPSLSGTDKIKISRFITRLSQMEGNWNSEICSNNNNTTYPFGNSVSYHHCRHCQHWVIRLRKLSHERLNVVVFVWYPQTASGKLWISVVQRKLLVLCFKILDFRSFFL